ncbi:MAG TPA: pitrilysin family protein [Candidatus Tectomicrobia bacterium]
MQWRGAVLAMVALLVVSHMAGAKALRERKRPQERGHVHVRGCTPAVKAETFTLDNGLRVVVLPMPRSPQVSYMVWYKAGGADDPAGKSGLAHLVEHATFRSTGTHGKHGLGQSLAYHSASEGEAFTSYDYTAYYHIVPRARLETVMQREVNRMASLDVSYVALMLEQEEIVAERREEIDGVPELRLDLHLHALLYPTHPYRVPVLGWPEEVARLTPQDVMTFHHTWYAPNNALLIVAGDITTVRLAPLVRQYYGRLHARPVPTRQRPPAAGPPERPRLVVQEPHVRTPLWQRSYRAPSYHAGETQHGYALQVLGEILAGEATGLLSRRLVGQTRLATAIAVDYMPDSLGETEFALRATPAPGVTLEALELAIDQALAAVVARSVSLTVVRQAQQRLRCQPPLAGVSALVGIDALGIALTTGRTLADVARWRARIAAVTPSQVHAAAQAVLRAERAVTGVLLPVAGGETTGIVPQQRKKR